MEVEQRVFEKLKERFMIEPVLVIPDLDKEMRVEVAEGVLLIKCEKEK